MKNISTDTSGNNIGSDTLSYTAGLGGPIVAHDHYLMEKLGHFNRERIPERVVHAKGSGAFGEFKVTHDVSKYTKACVFQPNTVTKTLTRFSTVAGEQGSPDSWRDPRGFSTKFYTPEGNYDLVGNDTPIFFIRDAIQFPDFIHSQKRMPGTGLRDNNMQWDFWTLTPATAHQVAWLMGDRGIPKTFRNMDGFGSHTFQWMNEKDERFWVKYHFKTNQGIEFLTIEESEELAGTNPDHHRKDLHDAIENKKYPSWTLKVQIMPVKEAANYRFNPFDLTKIWSQKDYPLIEVGQLTLNKNPDNFFAQVEQASFDPGALVAGIGLSPDKVLLARAVTYADAARYRVGANYNQLPVNAPKCPVHTNQQDGSMAYNFKLPTEPVYYPNSYNGQEPNPKKSSDYGKWDFPAELGYHDQAKHKEDGDFVQANMLVRGTMSEEERERLVHNVTLHLQAGVKEPVLSRAFEYWKNIDEEVGKKIEANFK